MIVAQQVFCIVHTDLLTACTILQFLTDCSPCTLACDCGRLHRLLEVARSCALQGFAPRMLHMAEALLVHISHPA